MFVAPLGSGSAGNCYYFESDGTRLLVDAGFGPRETAKRLALIGRSINDVRGILVTHEHSDHVHGVERIARKFDIPVYATRGTLAGAALDCGSIQVVPFENNSAFRIGDVQIHARRTMHDASDPSCFVLESVDGTRVGIASDLGCVDPPVLNHLSNCDGLFFEANHDLDMLRSGSYPWSLKRRIMSTHGHLSNDDAMAALQSLIGETTKLVCLIHLSEKNNHETIVRDMAATLVESIGAPIDLQIARQRAPLGILQVGRRPTPIPTATPGAQFRLF